MDELVQWLGQQLDEDERIAREASGSTVVGEPGNWRPAPGGDEWEVNRDDGYSDELLVALRPGLPRPPEVLGGHWGAVVSYRWEEDPDAGAPVAEFRHAARHDPARVLREVEAKRQVVSRYEQAAQAVEELSARRCLLHARGEDVFMTELSLESAIHERDALGVVLRLLALPYADRPGYREEWRP